MVLSVVIPWQHICELSMQAKEYLLNDLCFLIEILFILHDTRGQAMTNPRQELSLRLALKE